MSAWLVLFRVPRVPCIWCTTHTGRLVVAKTEKGKPWGCLYKTDTVQSAKGVLRLVYFL